MNIQLKIVVVTCFRLSDSLLPLIKLPVVHCARNSFLSLSFLAKLLPKGLGRLALESFHIVLDFHGYVPSMIDPLGLFLFLFGSLFLPLLQVGCLPIFSQALVLVDLDIDVGLAFFCC